MKTRKKYLAIVVALCAFGGLASCAAHAQALRPAAVIAIANLDEQFADAGYLVQAAGFPELGLFLLGKDEYTRGLDTSKPLGGIVTVKDMAPRWVGFVGVRDMQVVYDRIAEQFGPPEDAGGGARKVTGPNGNPLFIKEQNGWAFLSSSLDDLSSLPPQPLDVLGGLEKTYNLAARIHVQNIPKELRDMAIEQIKIGFEQSLEQQLSGADDAQIQAQRKLSQASIESLIQLLREADEVMLGWSIDPTDQSTFIDISSTAVAGTNLAQRMAVLQDSPSDFGGFVLPDAAIQLHVNVQMVQQDIDQLLNMLSVMQQQAAEELDDDENLSDDERAAAKEVVGDLFQILSATFRSGRMQGGGALLLAPQSLTLVGGGRVADGKAVEQLLRKVNDLAKSEPGFSGIQFNADQHGKVQLHTMSIRVPEDEPQVRSVLGDQLDVVFGIGTDRVYVALGKDAKATLKGAMDASQAAAQQPLPPGQMQIALTPIVQFAQSVSPQESIQQMSQALAQVNGKDKVRIVSRSIERGYVSRITLEEGSLRLIGIAIKSAQQAFFGGAQEQLGEGN